MKCSYCDKEAWKYIEFKSDVFSIPNQYFCIDHKPFDTYFFRAKKTYNVNATLTDITKDNIRTAPTRVDYTTHYLKDLRIKV
mgnify:CR=1 FL=1